ncbi:MAG: type I DNA topoisomerase [Elusimicrobia bacterium]|nr:type I DNA topoisomerase [Elusimicrobiota bacterium]
MPADKKTKTTKPKAAKAAKTAPAGEAAAEKAPKAPKAEKARKGSALVIVESPAKERTISRILQKDFVVRSSYGHVRDLPEKKMGVDEKKNFEPTYVLLPRTKKILPELEALAKKASMVYLATDHDREGESIAWHLVHLLDVGEDRVRRITFHEITPAAIQEAIKAPRGIDLNLVHAQQARRVIDRLVGYKLSPLLWKKVRRGLSAGRVQSVAVRLLVEREREIKEFASKPYYSLGAKLSAKEPPPFDARLTQWKGEKVESTQVYDLFSEQYRVHSTKFGSKEEIDAVVSALSGSQFKVVTVDKKEVRRRPTPPFTTSTLQQAASQRYGFPAEKTMRVAQGLYEGVDLGDGEPAGLITYMRTDSVSVAKQAQEEARRVIKSQFGDKYAPEEYPVYQTKSKGAQEAHEAIRPTSVSRGPDQVRTFLDPDQAKLSDLSWKRFVASQMTEAVYDTVAADIQAGPEAVFRANGRTLKFDGYLAVYVEAEEAETPSDEQEGRLPDLKEGDVLKLENLDSEEHNTSPPPHYNEASLIRALERHGIGRPSTYAPTIKTVVERGYVKRGIKDRKLIPSELGVLVTEKLKEHFPDVVSLTYTAEVEERLDQVAEGSDQWQKVVGEFYDPFQKALKTASTAMEDYKPIETKEPCPICGAFMLIRESRFGKYLSCSTFPTCKGKIRLTEDGQKAVPEMTEEKCESCGKFLVIRMGRRGKFLACSGYPACKVTYSLDAEGKKIEGSRPLATSRGCEKCSKSMWLRLGKRGHFLACSGFPKCRNLKPVGKVEAETLRTEALAREAELRAQNQNGLGSAAAAPPSPTKTS